MTNALDNLIEAVEAGNEDFIRSDDWINAWQQFYPEPDKMRSNGTASMIRAMNAYNGSIDAALALQEALLPRWTVSTVMQLRHPDNGQHPTGQWEVSLFAALPDRYEHKHARADGFARAWLLAILRAYRAQL